LKGIIFGWSILILLLIAFTINIRPYKRPLSSAEREETCTYQSSFARIECKKDKILKLLDEIKDIYNE